MRRQSCGTGTATAALPVRERGRCVRWTFLLGVLTCCGRVGYDARGHGGDADAAAMQSGACTGSDPLLWWRLAGAADDGETSLGSFELDLRCMTTDCPSRQPRAAEFSGGEALGTDPTVLGTFTALTASLWVRDDLADTATLFTKTVGTGFVNSLQLHMEGPEGIAFGISDGDSFVFTPAAPLPADRWAHVAATVDPGNQLVLYVDGVEAAREQAAYGPAFDDGPLLVGADADDGSLVDFFAGSLADVRLHDRALAPDEIAAMAAPGCAP